MCTLRVPVSSSLFIFDDIVQYILERIKVILFQLEHLLLQLETIPLVSH